ncbi:FabA-like domain protein [Marinicrinis sediminis]|uniref:FabA-like domain protein n=1 Tax=Marinicrinis sediminis TaxID=1652465 RepID=A0ABW5RFQ3_9BACL
MQKSNLMSLLPQQDPFRLIDRIVSYEPGQRLRAEMDLSRLYSDFGQQAIVPLHVLVESLAQTAVIYVQLETNPLEDHEVPLLGKVEAKAIKDVAWTQSVQLEITPVRILAKQAMLTGRVRTIPEEEIHLTAELYVAVSKGQVSHL